VQYVPYTVPGMKRCDAILK